MLHTGAIYLRSSRSVMEIFVYLYLSTDKTLRVSQHTYYFFYLRLYHNPTSFIYDSYIGKPVYSHEFIR